MRNYVTPRPELVYETTTMLQFDNCYVHTTCCSLTLYVLPTLAMPLIHIDIIIIVFLYFLYFYIFIFNDFKLYVYPPLILYFIFYS